METARIEELLNDFVAMFQVMFKLQNTDQAINRINQGSCGLAAWCVANVLRHEGQDVKLMSHCLHVWFEVDGVAYDTLYPRGYLRPPAEEWLLIEINEYPEVLELSLDDDGQSGYTGRSPYFAYLVIAWCKRFNLPLPDFIPTRLKATWLRNWRTKYRWHCAKARRRHEKAILLPTQSTLHRERELHPYTHYFYMLFESDTGRQLRPYPFTRPVKVLRFLNKEFRLKGISVWKQ